MFTNWDFVATTPFAAALGFAWFGILAAGVAAGITFQSIDSLRRRFVWHGIFGLWLAVGIGAVGICLLDMMACRLVQWCA